LTLFLVPAGASAQSPASSFSIQGAAGPTIVDPGHNLSAAIGFSPMPRLTLLLDVQRTHIPTRITRHEHGSSATRGGTLTALSGEVRVSLWPSPRVTPYALAGLGGGISRPNVNATFPSRVKNSAGFLFFGGGVQVPVRERLSVFGDVRMLAGAEGNDGVLAMIPVRVGVSWRF
jgi:hypothetical protein